jgi:hypothetical protein
MWLVSWANHQPVVTAVVRCDPVVRVSDVAPMWPSVTNRGRLPVLLAPDAGIDSGPMTRVYDPYHFLDRAVEYYVTGRFAALNNLQVAPNLFHHGVEMLTKFQLLRGVPDDRLAAEVEKYKQEPYGHNLHSLWSAFKADVCHSSLTDLRSIG